MFCQSIYHIIYSTFNLEETITKNGQRILYKYIWELLKQRNCELYRINGTANHIHMVIQLQPVVPLDGLMRDIQHSTNEFISESRIFPDFAGWKDGYYAFSLAFSEKSKVIERVKNQELVHQQLSFEGELEEYLKENGL